MTQLHRLVNIMQMQNFVRPMWLLVFGMVWYFAFPVTQGMATFVHDHQRIQLPSSTQHTKVLVPGLERLLYRAMREEDSHEGSRWRGISAASGQWIQYKRAPAQHVGAVMALLGTFHEAGVLPPEADPRANQLIRALIQFQSVFLKSEEPAVHAYLASALSSRWGDRAKTIRSSFYEQGWSSEALEAIVEYSVHHSMWADPGMQAAFQSYYLSPADWTLIQGIFLEARQSLVSQHQSIHAVFARQRLGMPGHGLHRN